MLTQPGPTLPPRPAPVDAARRRRLTELALDGMARMYLPPRGAFCFTLRRDAAGDQPRGESLRYTAIALIGLAATAPDAAREVLRGASLEATAARLIERSAASPISAGDAALTLWAAESCGLQADGGLLARIAARVDDPAPLPAVELSWIITALCHERPRRAALEPLARAVRRLIDALDPETGLAPHVLGGRGARSHVCCFADVVYPMQALAHAAHRAGDDAARDAAARLAAACLAAQGAAGQWWWHFDVRTGRIVEKYPVYAVHQHAMAPMALLAAQRACGVDAGDAVARGLAWLWNAPELARGGARPRGLFDEAAGLIWRKVARREPRKLARRLQAAASAIHPRLRLPAVDRLLPPGAIDYECRPYELGWLLYALRQAQGAGAAEADASGASQAEASSAGNRVNPGAAGRVIPSAARNLAPTSRRAPVVRGPACFGARYAPASGAATSPGGGRHARVLGVPIAPLRMPQVVGLAADAVARRESLLIGVVNAAKLVNMRRDAALREAVLAADVILADGMGVVWGARLLGSRLPERVAGIDLMMELLARGGRDGWRLFLLGAEQDVLDEVVQRVGERYPGVEIAGSRNGYYADDEEADVVRTIRASRADVLLVAMSSPRKECFLARRRRELGVPVCHGVGGAFDVLAGRVRRAPRSWQVLGLEWLYRLLQEPRRLARRYLVAHVLFVALLLREWLARVVDPRPGC